MVLIFLKKSFEVKEWSFFPGYFSILSPNSLNNSPLKQYFLNYFLALHSCDLALVSLDVFFYVSLRFVFLLTGASTLWLEIEELVVVYLYIIPPSILKKGMHVVCREWLLLKRSFLLMNFPKSICSFPNDMLLTFIVCVIDIFSFSAEPWDFNFSRFLNYKFENALLLSDIFFFNLKSYLFSTSYLKYKN